MNERLTSNEEAILKDLAQDELEEAKLDELVWSTSVTASAKERLPVIQAYRKNLESIIEKL